MCVVLYRFEKLLSANSSTRIERQLHFTDLLVNIFHKLHDKIDQFVLEHLFSVEICDEKGNVVTVDGTATQNEKVFGAHHDKAHKLLAQDLFDLVCLFDCNAKREKKKEQRKENREKRGKRESVRQKERLCVCMCESKSDQIACAFLIYSYIYIIYLTRTELMDVSMSTRSLALRAMWRGVMTTSGVELHNYRETRTHTHTHSHTLVPSLI